MEERVRSVVAWWDRCCGGGGGGLSLEVDGWMEWTRSANQAFTISLRDPEGELIIIIRGIYFIQVRKLIFEWIRASKSNTWKWKTAGSQTQ